MALPSRFDGTRKNLRGFLNQLEIVFNLQPSRYQTTEAKIFTVGSLLTGNALAWFNPIVDNPENYQPILSTWPAFKTVFHQTFGELDQAVTSGNALSRLSQGVRSAASYASEF